MTAEIIQRTLILLSKRRRDRKIAQSLEFLEAADGLGDAHVTWKLKAIKPGRKSASFLKADQETGLGINKTVALKTRKDAG